MLPEWAPIIGAVIGGLMSLAGVIWLHNNIRELHVTFNSKMDRLLDEVTRRATAEGHAAGIAEERARTDVMAQTLREEKREVIIPAGTVLTVAPLEQLQPQQTIKLVVPKKDDDK